MMGIPFTGLRRIRKSTAKAPAVLAGALLVERRMIQFLWIMSPDGLRRSCSARSAVRFFWADV